MHGVDETDLRRTVCVRAFIDFMRAAIASYRDLIEGRRPYRQA